MDEVEETQMFGIWKNRNGGIRSRNILNIQNDYIIKIIIIIIIIITSSELPQ